MAVGYPRRTKQVNSFGRCWSRGDGWEMESVGLRSLNTSAVADSQGLNAIQLTIVISRPHRNGRQPGMEDGL